MWKSILLALLLVAPGAGAISNEELLDAGEAFPARIAAIRRDAVEVTFKIADGYYLYRDKLRFTIASDAAHLGTPVLPKGTTIHVIAWHDNTTANKNNPDPDQWVGWGDRTVDEMAHAWVNVTYITEEDYKEWVARNKANQPPTAVRRH